MSLGCTLKLLWVQTVDGYEEKISDEEMNVS